MATVAVFVDIGNLYYCVGKRYDGRKLDYDLYYERVQELGSLYRAFAYGSQMNDEAIHFITCLRKIGYDTKYRKIRTYESGDRKEIQKVDWNVGIAMDVVRVLPRVDTIVIGSAKGDLVPLVQWVKDQGVRCVVFACGINRELKEHADQYIEIPEELLECPPEEDEESLPEATST